MAKRPTAIEKAIASLEDEIKVLQAAIVRLKAQQAPTTKPEETDGD